MYTCMHEMQSPRMTMHKMLVGKVFGIDIHVQVVQLWTCKQTVTNPAVIMHGLCAARQSIKSAQCIAHSGSPCSDKSSY